MTRSYIAVHAKKGKCEVEANSSYEAQTLAAKKLGVKKQYEVSVYLADVKHDPSILG